jgi:hypothetical protein
VQGDGPIDIRLLPALRATTEQHNERVAVLGKINPITRSPVDDIFTYTCEPFDVGGITKLRRNVAVTTFAAA